MQDPLTTWRCDVCGKVIDKPEHGWVEWYLEDRDRQLNPEPRYKFNIVHALACSCEPDRFLRGGSYLPRFLGSTGLTRLMRLKVQADLEGAPVREDSFAELVNRLHVPGHEELRSKKYVDPFGEDEH